MAAITIFGSGNMGQAIGSLLEHGGARVQYIGSADKSAEVCGDIVVLAVPYSAVDDVVRDYSAKLAGRIVVDVTNPIDFTTFDSLLVPPGSSAAERLRARLLGSTVLKAFNTNFAATLVSGTVGSQPTTVLVAGDVSPAKDELCGLVETGGLAAVDAGPLSRARELEALGFLQFSLAVGEKIGWNAGFALVP